MQRESLTTFHMYTDAQPVFKKWPPSQNPLSLLCYYWAWHYIAWKMPLVILG